MTSFSILKPKHSYLTQISIKNYFGTCQLSTALADRRLRSKKFIALKGVFSYQGALQRLISNRDILHSRQEAESLRTLSESLRRDVDTLEEWIRKIYDFIMLKPVQLNTGHGEETLDSHETPRI